MRRLAVELIERTEDAIYLLVAALLGIAAVGVLISAGYTAIQDLQMQHPNPVDIVLAVLDNGLILFMVAELLHTVRITVRDRSLAAEPFLIVGLIAGIRRVLIVTAKGESNFQWNPDGIELLILVGLILVMALAILLWRRSERDRITADSTAGSDG